MSSALDIQRERTSAIARELVERAPAGSIACIFAGGSLGRGEVWASEADGVVEVYSDIDLYVIACDGADASSIRAAAKTLARTGSERADARFLRPADIGVYTRDDLFAQPIRPGTVDLDRHHLMLHGDERIPRALSGREAAKIPMEEALYLLENRAMELSAAADSDPRATLALSLKARLDVYSAHAIMAGTFDATLAARAERFARAAPATLTIDTRRALADAFSATRDIGAWMRGQDAGAERQRSLSALAAAWRTLAPAVLHARADEPELVARRCRENARWANLRDVLRIRRATGRPLWRAALVAPALCRFAPVAALRIDALTHVFERESGNTDAFAAHFKYVDRLTSGFGFTDGPLEARVRAMHGAIS